VSLPKPYYSHAGQTIYHGDCREILSELPKVDLLCTDPPYGIGRDGGNPSTSSHGGRKPYEFLGWDKSPPSEELMEQALAKAENHIVWGANYFPKVFPASMGWFVWDKGQRIAQSDGELAYTSRSTALRILTLNRVELMKDGAAHPTQKPVKLMTWCLSFFPDAQTILDPFMGSGTTLVAAKQLGRQGIGIELEERYCEIAALRLSQEVMNFGEVA
jgi:DNA modification methylase